MSLNTKLILILIVALNANQILTMEPIEPVAPLSDYDERAAGSEHRYHSGRSTLPTEEELTAEGAKTTRSASPTTKQRKAAEQAENEKRKQQQADPEDASGLRQNFSGNVQINQFTKPYLAMGEQLRNPNGGNPSIEEENARREGELRGMRAAEEEKAFIKAQAHPDAIKEKEQFNKMHAAWNAQKAIEADRIVSEYKLTPQAIEREKAMVDRDVNLAMHKRTLLVNNQLSDANLEQERQLTAREVALYRAKEAELQRTDPNNSLRAVFTAPIWPSIVRGRNEAIAHLIATSIVYLQNNAPAALYKFVLKLPFQYCKDLKEQEEMFELFAGIEAQQRMLKTEKNLMQETLSKDARLLKDDKKDIHYIEKELGKVQDEKQKEQLQAVAKVLKQQHLESRIRLNQLRKLNFDQQPYFQRIIAEKQEKKMRQQKSERPEAGS